MNNIHIQYYFMSNVFCVIDNQQGVRASGIVHVDIDSLCVRNRILYSYRRFFPWIDRRCMIHEELCRALQLIFDQFDSSPIHTFSNTYWSTNDNKKKTRMYQTGKWLLLSHMSLISYPPPRWTIVTSVGFKSALSIPDFVQHLVILIIIIISFFSHAANLSSVRTPSSKTQALI